MKKKILILILMEKDVDLNNLSHIFAPGVSKTLVFYDPLAEFLTFPTIFCCQTNPENRG